MWKKHPNVGSKLTETGLSVEAFCFTGSLSLTDEHDIKPLSEGKRDLDKESVLNVIKNSDGQFDLEAAIKNVDTMSNELKKINVESQLLLCDLILNFNHPVKAKDLREAEEKIWSLTD